MILWTLSCWDLTETQLDDGKNMSTLMVFIISTHLPQCIESGVITTDMIWSPYLWRNWLILSMLNMFFWFFCDWLQNAVDQTLA